MEPTAIRVIGYNETDIEETTLTDLSEFDALRNKWAVCWARVIGLTDVGTLDAVGRHFGLHPLVMEDIADLDHHAKFEDYGAYMFVVLRSAIREEEQEAETQLVSLILGEGFVVSFERRTGGTLDKVRDRIHKKQHLLRERGEDYLMYVIIDVVIDSYFPILDDISDRMDLIERVVVERPQRNALAEVHSLKRDLLTFRRAVSPMREVVNGLIRDTGNRISEPTRIHLRDCYDHTFQILDLVNMNRDVAASLLEIYLTTISNRTNDTMKVLTVIATIFIPLTFVTGVYGMNFDHDVSPWNMPELYWYWGYPAVILLMIVITAVEFVFFWRKGWLSGAEYVPAPRRPRRKRRRRGASSESQS